MPLNETSGNLTTDAFGGGVAVLPKYIEDYFSAYLYAGNSSTQTITNGIDLSTKGGLVWIKDRTAAANHGLVDTVRGFRSYLSSDSAAAAYTNLSGYDVTAFNTNGFSLGPSQAVSTNTSGDNYVSWTWAKAPKFFDVVTYTGDGTNNRAISHNLGSVPGCIIVKSTSGGYPWAVKHRSLSSASQYLVLNDTAGQATTFNPWTADPTSSVFYVNGSASSLSNGSGATYVAYLFAHNAGGFGLTGTDNVISCGSCSTDGSGVATVNLGYEPQWLMVKRTDGAQNWWMGDVMRGMTATSSYQMLLANDSQAEATATNLRVSSTGFSMNNAGIASQSFIYIAIRRGPMKVPTDATKVFAPVYSTASTGAALTTNFPVDMQFEGYPPGDSLNMSINDRLRGVSTTATQSTLILTTSSTAAEASPNATMTNFWDNTGFKMPGYYGGIGYISWNFRRAPSFFDEVCYTGTGSATTVSHNLQAVPELVINKNRDGTFGWYTCFNFTSTTYDQNTLSTTNAANIAVTYGTGGDFFSAKPTTTGLPLSAGANNLSAKTYVSYLFATCAGVSKVFSFTGNGSTQAIACGFTGGARFVIIKATSTTGNWLTFDTARGMTTSTDPWLALNSTSAESATSGACTTTTGGFTVDESKLTGVNTNGVSYIGLAMAQT